MKGNSIVQTKTVLRAPGSLFWKRCATAFLIPFLVISAFLIQTGLASAVKLSPGIPRDNCVPIDHCYDTVTWNGNTGGAHVELDAYGNMSCASGCSGTVSDEIWFSDTKSLRFVEAGIRAIGGSVYVFWGYSLTIGIVHDYDAYRLGPSGMSLDPYYFVVDIFNTNSASSNGSNWTVAVNIVNTTAGWSRGVTEYVAMAMNASSIEIGSELTNSNAHGGNISYNYNQWEASNSSWNYQKRLPDHTQSDSPSPEGWWYQVPTTSSTGGTWVTYS
jgi:hypothetical protein